VFQTIIVPTGCAFFEDALSPSAVEPEPGGQMVFGDYHGNLHAVLLQPPEMHDVRSERTEATLPGGITDVEVGPDGALYVSTSGSIYRIAGSNGVPVSPGAQPTITAAGDEGGGVSGGTIVLIVAAIVLVVDVVIVLIVRARRRRAAPRDG
jgi:hypothetical protein